MSVVHGPIVAAVIAVLAAAPSRGADKLQFNRDIRPILAENCFACHGPDKNQRQAEMRLDVREDAVKAEAFVPGKADDSALVRRIFSTDVEEQMPPPKSHKKLTAAQKDSLKRWIAEGAEYQGHWAYQRPLKPTVPAGANGIDHLVEKRLTTLGLKPSPEADRRTLARRLAFDLVGLPPKPEAVESFAADKSPQAYDALVQKLLASPHYGERMAIGWQDVVRFADTIGYHSDNPRNVWPYRDYVIRSFNANKPFDQFTIEQLAGDLLPSATTEQKVASCFNRLLLTTEEGGAQPKDYEARMVADRVRAVGTVWLGQTFGCCQCHDHKFDPTSTRDFYSMGAFFADIQEASIGAREPGMLVLDDAQQRELARLQAEATVTVKLIEGLQSSEKSDDEAVKKLAQAELASLRKRLDAAKRAKTEYEAKLPKCLVSVSTPKPRTVRVLPRGNWLDETGLAVQPALPQFLVGQASSLTSAATPASNGKPMGRLELAHWIASRDNPLTARVFVNRLWKQFFGVGLSKNLDDLGTQGEWPANPELLDWLAVEFMDSGWNVQHIVRTIVTSHTYRQVSTASKELLARDPDNRELARQSRFRIDAEIVRDNALAVSGLLVPKIGGPSVKPYQPDGYWENLNFPTRQYLPDAGDNQYRRGLYTWWQRTFPHPSMLAFDAPSREECAADRPRSNIPQQALVLLNDPTYVEAARTLAARTIQEGGADAKSRIAWLWRQALQRPPRDEELQTIAALVEKHRAEYAQDAKSAAALLDVGFSPPPKDIDKTELAAWTSAARVVLNLHETITRN